MLVVSLLLLKHTSVIIAKEMVNFDTTKRITSNLFNAGRKFIFKSLENELENQERAGSMESTEYLVHNWLEALFSRFQMALLWHEPFLSLASLSGLVTVFMWFKFFAPRFYATILMAIFCYNLTIVWFRHIWPEIRVPPADGRDEESRLDVDRFTHLHPHLMTLSELGQLIRNLLTVSELFLRRLLEKRRTRPINFWLMAIIILNCTAMIGKLISGYNLILWTTLTLVLSPGIFLHLLPKSLQEYLRHYYYNNIMISSDQDLQSQAAGSTLKQDLPSASSSSSSSPPLLLTQLLDNLKQSSNFMKRQEPLIDTLDSGEEAITSTTLLSSSSDLKEAVPINESIHLSKTNAGISSQQEEPLINLSGDSTDCQKEPSKGDDLSSNESASLIDFEDEQQDGFVIL